MRITPLDIHHKKFKVSLRGYNEEEVDSFLDEIAGELDRVLKENNTLKEQTDQTKGKITEYQTMEQTLHQTLLNAQRLSDEIKEKAQKESNKALSDAKKEANKILSELAEQRVEILDNIKRLNKIENRYRENLLNFVNSTVDQINNTTELVDEQVIEKEEEISKRIEEIIPEIEEEAAETEQVETVEEVAAEETEEKAAEEIQPEAEAAEEEEVETEEVEAEEEPSGEETVQPELEPEQEKAAHDEAEGQEGSPDFFSREISEEEKPSFADLGEGIPGVLGRRQAKKKKKK